MGRKLKSKAQPACSADKVNEAFLRKVKDIRKPLLETPVIDPAPVNIPKLSAFKEVCAADVIAALKKDLAHCAARSAGGRLRDQLADAQAALEAVVASAPAAGTTTRTQTA